jgi:hypothetical protein
MALLGELSTGAREVYDTQRLGLQQIQSSDFPYTPAGQLGAPRHYAVAKNWIKFWEYRKTYSEVEVTNNGAQPATYLIYAKYFFNDTLFGLFYSRLNLVEAAAVTLNPGETQTVRIVYHDEEFGVKPEDHSDMTFLLMERHPLYGLLYLTHRFDTWNPQRMDSVGMAVVSSATDEDLMTTETPLMSFIIPIEHTDIYRVDYFISNPFTSTYQADVVQPLPAGVTVVGGDGVEGGNSVRWMREIAPRDIVSITLALHIPAQIGSDIVLPAATLAMQFVNDASTLNLVGNTPSLNVGAPFVANLGSYTWRYGAAQEITVTVTNAGTTSATPEMTLHIVNAEGSTIYTQSTTTDLIPNQPTNISYMASPNTLIPGQYRLFLVAHLGGGEALISTSSLVVEGGIYYLPYVGQ